MSNSKKIKGEALQPQQPQAQQIRANPDILIRRLTVERDQLRHQLDVYEAWIEERMTMEAVDGEAKRLSEEGSGSAGGAKPPSGASRRSRADEGQSSNGGSAGRQPRTASGKRGG